MRDRVLDPAARRLLDRIAAEPGVPVAIGVGGPGGYGKTTVLSALDEILRAAGVDDAVIVDDAHRLDGPRLRELAELARRPGTRLAVGYRPWPRPDGLGDLIAALTDRVDLTAYGPAEVATVLSGAGIRPGPGVVDLLHAQTGGVPGLVARLAAVVPPEPGDPSRLPDAAVAALRPDLDAVPPEVQRYLLAAEVGFPLDADLLGQLLDLDAEGVAATVAAARASGLVTATGAPVPVVRRAVALLYPLAHRVTVRRRLAELQLDRGGPVLGLARTLLGTRVTGTRIAQVFESAAEQALAREPALAARLYAAAAAAGRPVPALAVRWAHAAALAGDLDTALRLADQLIAGPPSPDRAGAARIAAAALAHRGQLAHSAALYRWSGTGSAAHFATVNLIATGDLAAAEALAGTTDGAAPTLFETAAALTARGVRASLTGTTTALTDLARAADLLQPTGQAALLPDSPAALGALVALHAGEPDVAGSILDRALSAGIGGPVLARRHRLVRAWVALAHGDLAAVRERHGGTGPDDSPRDRLFHVALDLGLARRTNDLAVLQRTWVHAREAVLRHPVDLFMLLPLGEVAVCAARLGEYDRIAPHLTDAYALLDRLGDPPLWTVPLRWHHLHAAIVADRAEVAREQAGALADLAHHGPYHQTLATAAQRWIEVLAGTVEPDAVDHAARGLYAIGLAADGAALAAQAAIRTTDRQATATLLDRARTLQGRTARGRIPAPRTPTTLPATAADDLTRLSDRELEVASLVVAGLTYRQIGDRLFISPKTIEHHVARMRQRLGCETRSDLIHRLRSLVAGAR